MRIREYLRNLPFFKKILLISFIITFFVVVSTAGMSFILQTKQLKNQMTNEVSALAALWSSTIVPEDVEAAADSKNPNHPSVTRLVNIVSLINEKASPFLGGYLILPSTENGNNLFVLASSRNYESLGYKTMSNYRAGEEFLQAFRQTRRTGELVSTDIYKDPIGTWITALAPIKNQQGELIAILGVEIDASIITAHQRRIAFILFSISFVIAVMVFFILHSGLKKVMEPINLIIHGINEVSTGNFNVRLEVDDCSDLARLSERFNAMAMQLGELFERLSATSRQLDPHHHQTKHLDWFDEAIDKMENIVQKTKLHRELQRAEKMNAIGQLAASVAHEIRNPMTVVKGFLQIFLSKEQMSEEEKMYIKLMIEEMNRAESIINDYLSLAKPDMEQTEKVNAAEIALNVMELMNSYAMMSKNISVLTDFQENVFIQGNKNELKQVLINILKNGIEAMKDGGELALTVKKEGGYGVFIIRDTGIGMTPEELDRLGTAFYSLKEKGTGMGLMVCYQIVERMKGRIESTSKKNEGTTFHIYIPLHEDE